MRLGRKNLQKKKDALGDHDSSPGMVMIEERRMQTESSIFVVTPKVGGDPSCFWRKYLLTNSE